MIKPVKTWQVGSTLYTDKEEATLAVIDEILDLDPDQERDAKIKQNATQLINLLSVFSRKQVRAAA